MLISVRICLPSTPITDDVGAEQNCPDSKAYVYDDSVFECDAALNADYTITFCPPYSVFPPDQGDIKMQSPFAIGESCSC